MTENYDALQGVNQLKEKNYPREVWVSNVDLHDQFVSKCDLRKIRKSTAITLLVKKWIEGKIKI